VNFNLKRVRKYHQFFKIKENYYKAKYVFQNYFVLFRFVIDYAKLFKENRCVIILTL